MSKVDNETMVCNQHNVVACIVCMTDDYHDWEYQRAQRRRSNKAKQPIHELFDLGGEA